jgi:hypothetical protein
MRTKHTEVIKAWLDGAEVEFKLDNKWIPKSNDIVYFFEDTEYRIKPKKEKTKYTIGQLFRINHSWTSEFTGDDYGWEDDYILCQVEAYELALVGLSTGNRISSPLIFNEIFITEDELWDLIVGPAGDRTDYSFTCIGTYNGMRLV